MKNLHNDPSLFKINKNSKINVLEFYDPDNRNVNKRDKYPDVTKIFWIDNFYENPELVYQYLNSIEPPLWKMDENPSNNTKYFEDRRHMIKHKNMKDVYEYLSNICYQEPTSLEIVTNYTRFTKCEENNYVENYWWPHHDSGYNGICYFTDGEETGTNIYKPKFYDRPDILALDENDGERKEHFYSWTPKKYWELVLSFKAKWNRFVMFDGYKYYHGMDICDDKYYANHWSKAKYRINQVFFFNKI